MRYMKRDVRVRLIILLSYQNVMYVINNIVNLFVPSNMGRYEILRRSLFGLTIGKCRVEVS